MLVPWCHPTLPVVPLSFLATKSGIDSGISIRISIHRSELSDLISPWVDWVMEVAGLIHPSREKK